MDMNSPSWPSVVITANINDIMSNLSILDMTIYLVIDFSFKGFIKYIGNFIKVTVPSKSVRTEIQHYGKLHNLIKDIALNCYFCISEVHVKRLSKD